MKLKLHTQPDVPLEAESITPAVITKLKVKEIEKWMNLSGNELDLEWIQIFFVKC